MMTFFAAFATLVVVIFAGWVIGEVLLDEILGIEHDDSEFGPE